MSDYRENQNDRTDLLDLDHILSGVDASELSVADILAEVYGTSPSSPKAEVRGVPVSPPPSAPAEVPVQAPQRTPDRAVPPPPAKKAKQKKEAPSAPPPPPQKPDAGKPSASQHGAETQSQRRDRARAEEEALRRERSRHHRPSRPQQEPSPKEAQRPVPSAQRPVPSAQRPAPFPSGFAPREDMPHPRPAEPYRDRNVRDRRTGRADAGKSGRSKLLSFPGAKRTQRKSHSDRPAPAPEEKSPSAWEEPKVTDLPPVLVEMALDRRDRSRPDGYIPPSGPRIKKLRQSATLREGEQALPDEELPVDPELKGVHRNKFSDLLDRADAYADTMFDQAGNTDRDTRMAEKYIPGTDQEILSPKKIKKRRKWGVPRAEDTAPTQLSHIFLSGLNFMNLRILLMLFLSVVSIWLALGQAGYLSIGKVLSSNPRLLAACMAWLLGAGIALSLDVLWMGISSIFQRIPGFHSMAAAAVFFTLADAIHYIITLREGSFPLCAPAVVLLCANLWGAYQKKAGNYRASRLASTAHRPKRVIRSEDLWNSRDTFVKADGDFESFGRNIQSPDGVQTLFRLVAPVLFLLAVILAVLSSVGKGEAGRFLWCLSVILISASPLAGLLAYGFPWFLLVSRLEKAGAAVAGWPGVRTASGSRGVLITDRDLFPSGAVQFNGIKIYGDIPLEKLASCAGSLILHSGSDLSPIFENLIHSQGGFYRGVEDFRCYEAGGLSGHVRGELVLVGSAAFMTMMDIPLPHGLNVKHAVFCAIDGSLRGIFVLHYAKTNSIPPALHALIREGFVPVLSPRDFNVTPAMLRQNMDIPVERMEYPPVERRMELTDPEQNYGDDLCAILNRDSMEGYSDTLVGCRRMKRAVRLNTFFLFLSSFSGLLLGFFLTATSSFFSLSPVNVLAFLILWLIPALLVSGNVTHY